ncbi:hypothetical protein SARC_11206, partial [Sphaeroforma arctica JP610]
ERDSLQAERDEALERLEDIGEEENRLKLDSVKKSIAKLKAEKDDSMKQVATLKDQLRGMKTEVDNVLRQVADAEGDE